MKGYWHIVVISVVISLLTIVYTNYLLPGAFFIWLFLLHYFKRLGKTPLVFSLLFFLFFSMYIPSIDKLSEEANLIQHSDGLSGTIVSPVTINDTRLEFIFHDSNLRTNVQVNLFLNNETLSPTDYSMLQHGARCMLFGSVELPDQSTNPGQFDYRNYLLTKGITHQLLLQTPNDFQCEGSSLLNSIFSFRFTLINYVTENISNESAAWLNALVLGDESLLDADLIELFQRWSLSHILAISGLHVGLIIGLIYFLLIKCNVVTKENAQWFMMLFLPFYALLAGGEPSVWRASTMALLFIVINKTKIQLSVTDILSIVFIMLVLSDRFIIYHVGFQLSFMVTFGLILSRHWILNSSRGWQLLQISFVSQMMILPLLFTYFSLFQPLSIILNVIVVPYFSLFVIPFMFILLLLIPFPSILTSLFDFLFVEIHNKFLTFIYFIDQIGNYPLIIGELPFIIIIVYYGLFFLFMKNIEIGKTAQTFKYGLSIVSLLIFYAIQPYLSPVGTVTMLDIGQGDAFVIELPYRKGVIFVDAGARFSFDNFEPDKRVYNQVIQPFLYSKGISKVSAIILSHEHLDHIGSVPFLLEDMDVDNIVISDYYLLDKEEALVWEGFGVTIDRVAKNELIKINGQEFHALAPSRSISANENSLVVYTELGGKSWIFTGDIGLETEREIIDSYPDLSVDILKVAHHGSDTSTDEKFLQQINAEYALIPVGFNNTYGHPSEEVLDTLIDANLIILRTDLNGAVQYNFKNNNGTFSTHLPYNTHSSN